MTFGETVRALRHRHRLTQRELAKRLAINFTYLSKIENDALDRPPSVSLTRALAHQLGADPDALVDLSGHIDGHALQRLAMRNATAARFLRTLQKGRVSRDQLRRILRVLEEEDHDE